MKVIIDISEELYEWLREEAKRRNLESAESVIQELQHAEEMRRRREVVQSIREFHNYMAQKYGRMEDSVAMIREDRDSR